MYFAQKYKAVFLDLDGTLLASKPGTSTVLGGTHVSPRNLSILSSLQQKKIPVIIATGRSINSIRKVLTVDFPCKHYVASLNGAVVFDSLHGNIARELALEENLVQDIFLASKQISGIENLVFDTAHTYYSPAPEFSCEEIAADYGCKGYKISSHTEIKSNIYAALLYTPQAQMEVYMQLCQLFGSRANIIAFHGWPWIEIGHPHAGKGKTLREICGWLNVLPSEVVAFGDGSNDMEMLSEAGFPVAMANANEKLKSVARYITSSNNEDGVAEVLEQLSFHK